MIRLLTGLTVVFVIASTAHADDWPQWRGSQRSGVSQETGLLQSWPETGPPLRWQATDIGTGYSSPAIADGRVYLQTTHGDQESALALDEKTGKQLWSAPIGGVGKNRGPQYPGTRSTPTVDGETAYCLSSDGQLSALDAATGKVRWQRDFKEDFQGVAGNWAYSESVLVDGDRVVCTPGGQQAALVALNKHTGELIWQTDLSQDDNAEYSSIMVVGGKDSKQDKQYVQFLRKGVVGVDAETGKLLWRYDGTVDQGANIMTPIVVGNRVFTAGARAGGGLVELRVEGENVQPKELYFERELGASIGGAVLVDGYLYGTTSQVMFCADFATGEIQWKDRALGAASIAYADNRLYVRSHKNGDVALVVATPEGYQEKGRIAQPRRSETAAWPHPVIANGGLYLRDQGTLLCYDIRGE